jgi:hypothetical protein
MPDRPLFDLAPGWRLAHDQLQWVLQRYQGDKWRALHFIATKKAVLRRTLRVEGVILTPDAQRAVDALPDTFKGWKHTMLAPPKRV